MSNVTGQGFILLRGAATGGSLPAHGADTYSEVLDTEGITAPGATREVDEYFVTNQAASKKLIGPVSYSNAAVKVTWIQEVDAVQKSLETDSRTAGGVRRNWKIQFGSTGKIQHFVGYVNSFKFSEFTGRGRAVFDVEIVVDGDVTDVGV